MSPQDPGRVWIDVYAAVGSRVVVGQVIVGQAAEDLNRRWTLVIIEIDIDESIVRCTERVVAVFIVPNEVGQRTLRFQAAMLTVKKDSRKCASMTGAGTKREREWYVRLLRIKVTQSQVERVGPL